MLLGLLLANSFGFSQTENTSSLQVTESAPFEDDSNTYEVVALKTTPENQTGIVREGKRDLAFEIFDENQKRVFSELVDIDRKEKFIGQVFGGTIIKVITVNEVSREDREVSCYSFDLANRSITKTPLFTAQVDRNEDLFFLSRKRQTSIAISEDSRYFAVATDDFNKNSNQYTVRVFDAQDLSLKFQKAYQEGGERYFEPNDIFITNEAEVFVVGKLYKEGRAEKKKKKANYDFVLNKVTESESRQKLIGLENEFVQSLNITANDNMLNLYGFYSEDRVRKIKGSCKFMVDRQTLEVIGKQASPLPVSVFEDLFGSERGADKADSELANFTLDHILTDTKGNVYLIAEEFYVTVIYTTYGTTTVPHFDDIILLKYTAEGDLAWGRSIFKRENFASYNAFLKDDSLHILLNSGKNLTEKEDGRTKASKGWFESSALYDFEYTAAGEVEYNKIQDNKGNTKYFPANGTYKNGTFLMMSGGGRERQFMMLK